MSQWKIDFYSFSLTSSRSLAGCLIGLGSWEFGFGGRCSGLGGRHAFGGMSVGLFKSLFAIAYPKYKITKEIYRELSKDSMSVLAH